MSISKKTISKKVIFELSLILLFLIALGFLLFSFDSPFSVIVLPDIQNYSSRGNEEILFSQINWIIQNKDTLNIKFVAFEGDLVNNWDKNSQWFDANKAVALLEENNIPFLLVPGNHDHDKTNPTQPLTNYNLFFPSFRFENNSWWGGSYGAGNTYQIIRVGLKEYLFLGLDACPTNDEVYWANEVFSANEDKELILVTHGYLDTKANRNVHVCGNTEYIWAMIKTHRNLQVTLSGHVHGESILVSLNDYNLPVTQMLADYQDDINGGNGYLISRAGNLHLLRCG